MSDGDIGAYRRHVLNQGCCTYKDRFFLDAMEQNDALRAEVAALRVRLTIDDAMVERAVRQFWGERDYAWLLTAAGRTRLRASREDVRALLGSAIAEPAPKESAHV